MRIASNLARQACSRLIPLFLIGLTTISVVRADDWEVATYRGRPYLSLESIQKSYGFKTAKTLESTFELRGSGAVIKGEVDDKMLHINGLTYALSYAPTMIEKRPHISAFDVANLLDLILRPTEHIKPQPIKTVYVEAVEDKWSTRPDANDITLELQHALAGFGVTVELVPTNSGVISAEANSGAGILWLRFQGNGKLSHYEYRCSVLAAPGSPERAMMANSAEEVRHVYPGNRFAAESLALATLIQSGLAFGPGAKNGNAIDAGIHQMPSHPFQSSTGAAVHVEWGEEVDPVHLLKSVAAGILRYSGFIDGLIEGEN
tara:strand:+ start:5543 stop:6496 length:954 start_codon:yes stop_codon:yes gene_type:complete